MMMLCYNNDECRRPFRFDVGCIKYNTGETPVEAGWPVHSIVSEVFFMGEAIIVYLTLAAPPPACLHAGLGAVVK